MSKKLRVWWIPQVPMQEGFTVPVESVKEGIKVMSILASCDAFQFDNNIKPDYLNAGGLVQQTVTKNWEGWEEEDGMYDDPEEFIKETQRLVFNHKTFEFEKETQ